MQHPYPHVESFADLYVDPVHGTIRMGEPPLALRVLAYTPPTSKTPYSSTHYYMHLGTYGMCDALPIISGVFIHDQHSNSLFAGPLPDPLTVDESNALYDALGACLPRAVEMELLHGMLHGEDSEYHIERIGGRAAYDELKAVLASSGFTIRGSKFVQSLKADIEAKMKANAANAAHTQVLPGKTSGTPQTHTARRQAPTDPHRTALAELILPHVTQPAEGELMGAVAPLPPEIFAQLVEHQKQRAASRQTSTGRIRWPFKDMKVGDHATFSPLLAKRASAAAHTYAARKKWNLTIMRAGDQTVILRMEDKA